MSTMLRSSPLRLSLLTAACLAAASSSHAQATGDGAQRVEITGSRLKQVDAEGASPVQVINRDEIRQSGATNVRELLDKLTVTSTNGSTINDVNGSGTFSPGASQASLRNLGAQSTLLLVNGRRIAVYPLPNFQETFSNIDTIPFEAVDRVEVLKIGGSAVYGSDAIAGVINIITRTDFTGIAVDASTQHSTRNGRFGEKTASITGGLGDYNKDGYNIMGTVEVFKRDSVTWNQVLDDVNPIYGRVSGVFGTGSTFSFPGNIAPDTHTPPQALPGCAGTISATGACLYDRYSRFEAVPETNKVNALLAGRVRVNDQTEWFTEALFSRIRSTYLSTFATTGQAAGSTTWPGNGEQVNTFYPRGLPVGHPLNPYDDEAQFRYRFADSESSDKPTSTQYRVLTGLKGTYKDWDYETALGALGATTHDREHGRFSLSGFKQVIGDPGQPDALGNLPDLAPDYFNKPGGYVIGGPNSQQVLDTLFPEFGWSATTRQVFLDGNARGKIYDLAAGPVNLSAGFELRHESQVLTPTANLGASDIVGLSYSSSDGSRNYGALFSELNVPLSKQVDMGLALRYDKFPHFAGHFSPRANVAFRPSSDLLFRGTIETGFRAPNLQESGRSSKTAYQPGILDPKRCEQANALIADLDEDIAKNPQNTDLDLAREQTASNECSGSVPIVVLNNPGLKPELSLSKSIGTVFQMTRDWSVTMDYWMIERRNEINLRPVQDVLGSEDLQPPGTIQRQNPGFATDPTFSEPGDYAKYGVTAGKLLAVHQMWENLFKTRLEGLDLGVTGVIPTPIGKWTAGLEGTWNINYQHYSATRNVTGGWGDNLSGRYGYPEFSTVVSNTLQTGDFSNTLRWTHQSAQRLQQDFDEDYYSDANCADTLGLDDSSLCHIKNYNRWDYTLTWSGVKGLTVGANVLNVFNKRPPVDMRAFGGSSGVIPVSNEDAEGRILKLFFTYKFL
jgi:iron complex outermembrane receptor protein